MPAKRLVSDQVLCLVPDYFFHYGHQSASSLCLPHSVKFFYFSPLYLFYFPTPFFLLLSVCRFSCPLMCFTYTYRPVPQPAGASPPPRTRRLDPFIFIICLFLIVLPSTLPPRCALLSYSDSKELDRRRARIKHSEGGDIPPKYFVVTNNQLLRVKYLLVYSQKQAKR